MRVSPPGNRLTDGVARPQRAGDDMAIEAVSLLIGDRDRQRPTRSQVDPTVARARSFTSAALRVSRCDRKETDGKEEERTMNRQDPVDRCAMEIQRQVRARWLTSEIESCCVSVLRGWAEMVSQLKADGLAWPVCHRKTALPTSLGTHFWQGSCMTIGDGTGKSAVSAGSCTLQLGSLLAADSLVLCTGTCAVFAWGTVRGWHHALANCVTPANDETWSRRGRRRLKHTGMVTDCWAESFRVSMDEIDDYFAVWSVRRCFNPVFDVRSEAYLSKPMLR